MSPKDRFKSFHPQSIYVDIENGSELVDLVYQNSWIKSSDKFLSLEKPGEGNMNFVARVKTSSASIIVKQSRPWVEKYPQIAAPTERIFVEAEFYKSLTHDNFYDSFCPHVIGFDRNNFLLALEDLGQGTDCTFMYDRNTPLEGSALQNLTAFISHLHNNPLPTKQSFPDNASIKKLNHTHIFYYPYLADNGFNLDSIQPGLQAISLKYKSNSLLKDRLNHLGEVYLQKGNTLVHGDFYPGSWLKTQSGIKIIDPEFSHIGHAEFDLGVMMAHLKMAHAKSSVLNEVISNYKISSKFDISLFSGFCGAEIMRRLIGLAQLPVNLSLAEKSELLDFAEMLILDPITELVF